MCEEFAPSPSINRESWPTQEFAPYLSTQDPHFHLPSYLQCLTLKYDLPVKNCLDIAHSSIQFYVFLSGDTSFAH